MNQNCYKYKTFGKRGRYMPFLLKFSRTAEIKQSPGWTHGGCSGCSRNSIYSDVGSVLLEQFSTVMETISYHCVEC